MSYKTVLDILVKKNEVTWQNIIFELIKSEQLDPWDVDISKLTKSYLEIVQKLQEVNFFLSGNVLLASALLVKIKSTKLMEEDLANFDNILFQPEEDDTFDELEDFYDYTKQRRKDFRAPPLSIKTPQARKRRISVNDLVSALEKVLEVNKRRVSKRQRYAINVPLLPEKKVDMKELTLKMLEVIRKFVSKKEEVTFTKLLPEKDVLTKKDKILTLYPLLHLDFQSKIDLEQEEPFEEIYIKLK